MASPMAARPLYRTEMVSKPQITFKGKAQLDVKAEHIQ
jgi:hypothetical protein